MEKKKSFNIGKYGVLIVLILLFIFLSIFAPNFLAITNIFNVARQIASLGIVVVGMTCVMITGGIDLSVGYQISLVNIICAFLMVDFGVPPVLAALIVLLMGTLIGFVNGMIIVKSGVAPLIVTLAVFNMLKGLSYTISGGLPKFGFPDSFKIIGQGTIFGGIPISMIFLVVIFLIGGFILNRTTWGRYFYAIGSNEEAVKLSGVNVKRVRVLAHTLCGFFTAIAGILLLSRAGSGVSSTGDGYEFDAITACVLGGVSAQGGKGTIVGALLGVLIVGFLNNGLLLMNVNAFIQLIAKGLLMLIAVIWDTTSRRKAERIRRIKAINVANE